MPTIIDSFLVEVGLDTSKLQRAQKEVDSGFDRTKEAAARTGKEMEYRGEQAGRFFSRARNELIAFFAAFELGRGIKEFVSDITKTDAATGYLAKTLDMSAQDLAAWQGAVKASGGTAEGATGSLQALTTQLKQYQLTGQAGPAIQYFTALGISLRDSNGHWKNAGELYRELAERLKGFDPATAANILRAVGADQGTINAILKGRGELDRLLEAYKNLAPSDADIAAAQARQNSFQLLDATLTELGRTILTDVSPMIVAALNGMQQWVDANRAWIEQGITGAVHDFGEWLKAIDWRQVGADAKEFIASISNLIEKLGGAKTIAEGFFALWAAAKIAGIVSGIGQIAGALSGLVGIGVGTGALAALLHLSPAALLLLLKGDTGPQLTPDEQAKTREFYGGTAAPEPSDAEKERLRDQPTVHSFGEFWGQLKNYFGGNTGGVQKQSYRPSGGGLSRAQTIAYIRESAMRRNIDPNIAVAVANSEGLDNYVGDRGSSFGPFQLHKGGIAGGGMAVRGLGDEFQQRTGLDPADPATTRQQIDFALDTAAKRGWGAWHGWKGTPQAGIMAQMGEGAQSAAMAMNSHTNNQTTQVHIGAVTVHTAATDAEGIARDLGPAIQRSAFASQANYGLS